MAQFSVFQKLGQLGLNEADTLKSSSILVYSSSEQRIYIRGVPHDAVVIESEIKKEILKLINTRCK
jgi:hypothetical protein